MVGQVCPSHDSSVDFVLWALDLKPWLEAFVRLCCKKCCRVACDSRYASRYVGHISLQILQKLREKNKLVPVTPVARQDRSRREKAKLWQVWCGQSRTLVTTGRTRLSRRSEVILPQDHSRFGGFNSSLRDWTVFNQESISLKGQPTCVCCLDLGKRWWNLALVMTSFSWTCKVFFGCCCL